MRREPRTPSHGHKVSVNQEGAPQNQARSCLTLPHGSLRFCSFPSIFFTPCSFASYSLHIPPSSLQSPLCHLQTAVQGSREICLVTGVASLRVFHS